MLRIHQIKCGLDEHLDQKMVARKLGCPADAVRSYAIERESLDARRDSCMFSYTVLADVRQPERYLHLKDVQTADERPYEIPVAAHMPVHQPVIAGFGPAGMFAGLLLAEAGLKPLILERGAMAKERQSDVQNYFSGGPLNPESNVQYGEGGAGTFSDGKLTTRIKDDRVRKVIAELIEAGAPEKIAYEAHPHLGTDRLVDIVTAVRHKIIRLGGEVRFHERLEGIRMQNGRLSAVLSSNEDIPADCLILCIGHSARDTYEKLYAQQVFLEQKEFAVGARAEHPQILIDRNQYGRFCGHPRLEPAEYHLTHTAANGRGVYTFCMCPGGIVIPSASEPETIVVNGMSYSARNGKSANSAILVQVSRSDFDHGDPFDGFRFQHELEARAWQLAQGTQAPAQNITDFLRNETGRSLVQDSTYPLGTCLCNLRDLFPQEINDAMADGLQAFDRRIPGYVRQGILVGLESRSSSPVRLLRQADGQSVSTPGLYPCGEGAGYAGGIVSSAVDGIRQAENYIRSLQ